MNMKQSLAILLLLIGCTQAPPPPAVNDAAASSDAVVVTDRLDRRVTFEQPARRIVSLSPATTELVFALGLGDRVVGVTTNCNYPPATEGIAEMGGGTLESLSIETIAAARPDLVLTKWDDHQPLVASLDRLGIRSLAVGPSSLDELFADARLLGRVTGTGEQAEALAAAMTTRRDRLAAVARNHQPSPPLRVFYEVWDDPLMTAGPGTFLSEPLAASPAIRTPPPAAV